MEIFVGPSASASSKSIVHRKRKAFPTDPYAFIPGAGKDSATGTKSSDSSPLIPPKFQSLFKKKKVVEVTARPQVAPSQGKRLSHFFFSKCCKFLVCGYF